MIIKPENDAYGKELLAYHEGKNNYEIVERSDKLIGASEMISMYFAPFEEWPETHQRAMKHVHGRVLDIGCGAGRVGLHLQEQGHDVVGIDNSPGAIEVCKTHGVKDARLVSITQVSREMGIFDTITMLGNNFELFGNPNHARWLLRKLNRITRKGAKILAESHDPYATDNPVHHAYHQQNIKKGRMAGQLRLRIRYLNTIGAWFDYLIVSKQEMEEIVRGTGWTIKNYMDGDLTYVAVIEKDE